MLSRGPQENEDKGDPSVRDSQHTHSSKAGALGGLWVLFFSSFPLAGERANLVLQSRESEAPGLCVTGRTCWGGALSQRASLSFSRGAPSSFFPPEPTPWTQGVLSCV